MTWKPSLSAGASALALIVAITAVDAAEQYPVPPEAIRQAGVPAGQLVQGQFRQSQVFPGTQRDYWVYIPTQLDTTKPAPIMVFQDGRNYCNDQRGARAHIVFDNMIHAGALPPLIGLSINPGVVPAAGASATCGFTATRSTRQLQTPCGDVR